MTKTKHTPGPWDCYISGHDNEMPVIQRGKAGGFRVMALDVESANADARLIAAAPELLEALEHCKVVLTIVNGVDKDLLTKEALERVSAAITKAEGGE